MTYLGKTTHLPEDRDVLLQEIDRVINSITEEDERYAMGMLGFYEGERIEITGVMPGMQVRSFSLEMNNQIKKQVEHWAGQFGK